MRAAFRVLARPSLAAIALAGTVTSNAGAQQAAGAWRIQPTAGLWWLATDEGWDNRLGQFAGLEVSCQRGERIRVTASTGFYRIGDADVVEPFGQGQPRTEYYDYQVVPLSVGAAYDVWQSGNAARPAALSLGFEVGALWGREHLVRAVGLEPIGGEPGPGEFSPVVLAAPAITVRRAVARQVEVTAGLRGLVGFLDGVEAATTFSAGLAWRL